MITFGTLIENGNAGFFQSCEVTQVFLHNKATGKLHNFYILACLEEKSFSGRNHSFQGKRYPINSELSLCIQRYQLSIDKVIQMNDELATSNIWNFDGNKELGLGKLKLLPGQFIPSTDGNRLNRVLKNNFHAGSYIVEYFDESKADLKFLREMSGKKFQELQDHISKQVPLDLSIVPDRLGNIIFQFPINMLQADSRSLKSDDGIELCFNWNAQVTDIPDCEIQIQNTLDKNFLSARLESYDKSAKQVIRSGNTDSITNILIWRKFPSLLLSQFSGTYIRGFNFNPSIGGGQPRLFQVDKKMQEVSIYSNERSSKKPELSYLTHIGAQVNKAEKKRLADRLSFKQYNKVDHELALQDLIELIRRHGSNGVYLWDPFLTSEYIVRTLYYAEIMGAELRAIGSLNKKTRAIYKIKSEPPAVTISKQRKKLENSKNNNFGLNLEFRMQYGNHGWGFHDRFLIFPGDIGEQPKVFSLGTSLNSFGKSHHILQEVSYPQPVIDAFNDLWDQLNKPQCIVWKYPKSY